MKKLLSLSTIAIFVFANCTTMGTGMYSGYPGSSEPVLARSLFSSDQAVISQAAIDTILSSKIVIPNDAKLALIKFPGAIDQNSSIYGYGYWRSEWYLNLQQSYVDTLSNRILSSEKISSVSVLPSLLTPQNPTIPILREAAVRLQSPLLVIYRINSDIYEEYRAFRANRSKAYATVELVLLDVRTGIIPFTAISTKEFQSTKQKSDVTVNDFLKRTEAVAVNMALEETAEKLTKFLASN
jgi:hypothetical protein